MRCVQVGDPKAHLNFLKSDEAQNREAPAGTPTDAEVAAVWEADELTVEPSGHKEITDKPLCPKPCHRMSPGHPKGLGKVRHF